LHRAAAAGSAEAAEVLMRKGASLSLRNFDEDEKKTPLMVAESKQNLGVAKVIRLYGLSIHYSALFVSIPNFSIFIHPPNLFFLQRKRS